MTYDVGNHGPELEQAQKCFMYTFLFQIWH